MPLSPRCSCHSPFFPFLNSSSFPPPLPSPPPCLSLEKSRGRREKKKKTKQNRKKKSQPNQHNTHTTKPLTSGSRLKAVECPRAPGCGSRPVAGWGLSPAAGSPEPRPSDPPPAPSSAAAPAPHGAQRLPPQGQRQEGAEGGEPRGETGSYGGKLNRDFPVPGCRGKAAASGAARGGRESCAPAPPLPRPPSPAVTRWGSTSSMPPGRAAEGLHRWSGVEYAVVGVMSIIAKSCEKPRRRRTRIGHMCKIELRSAIVVVIAGGQG